MISKFLVIFQIEIWSQGIFEKNNYLPLMILIWDHDVETLSKMIFPRVLIDFYKKDDPIGPLGGLELFQEITRIVFESILQHNCRRDCQIWKWIHCVAKVTKKDEIANLCLLIHFVAKFCRHAKIWETRVVPGLPHTWLVLLRSWSLEEKLNLKDQDLKISPRRISGWPTWSARLSCRNRWWRIL